MNTVLNFKKIKNKNCFDLEITYHCFHNNDSEVRIYIPYISDKDLTAIRDEIDLLIKKK